MTKVTQQLPYWVLDAVEQGEVALALLAAEKDG